MGGGVETKSLDLTACEALGHPVFSAWLCEKKYLPLYAYASLH